VRPGGWASPAFARDKAEATNLPGQAGIRSPGTPGLTTKAADQGWNHAQDRIRHSRAANSDHFSGSRQAAVFREAALQT